MDLYEALYTTRSMRRLKPDPIPYEVQARILDAAIHAPNIEQQWRFLLSSTWTWSRSNPACSTMA